MKVAISLPDPLFREAEEVAGRLRLSRSQLYATALDAFLERQRADRITERLNAVYSHNDSSVDEVANRMQFASVEDENW